LIYEFKSGKILKKFTRNFLNLSIISLITIYSISIVFVESTTEEITDFSNFTILYDTTLITSVNYDTHLTFIHNDESSGTKWEGQLYNFSTLGNYSDFYANVTVEYEYTGSMLTEAVMELGTSFYLNGSYGGPNIVNRLFSAGLWDSWSGSGGKYFVRAFPNNIQDQYESGSGTLGSSGTVVFHCNRTSNVVEIKITKQGILQIAHTWIADVSRPINYIYFFMGVDPTYCTYSMVNFTSIYVSFATTNILYGINTYK